METLRETLILVCADDFPSEKLPCVAADALVRGVDSPLLRELAGEPTDDLQHVRDLFFAAMAEMGVPVPSREEAIWGRVYGWAADMVAGKLDAQEGASRIGWLGWRELGEPAELLPFERLASMCAASPELGPHFMVEEMLVEARALLERRPRS